MANLKQENKTLSDQLTKEIKNNAELRQNYDLQLQKTKKDYLFFVEQIKTLRNENDHLKHRVKQSSDMSYPSASNIRQSSPSNDFQNSESKTDHKKSDDNEKENGKPMKTIIHSPSGLKISESNQKNHSHRLLGLVQGFVTAKPDIFKIITLLTGNSQALNNQMPSPYLNNDNLKAMLKGIPTLASILSYS
jgi:hypothetical protein